ncbi:MAG: histidine kinase [Bacteroidales bacterium]
MKEPGKSGNKRIPEYVIYIILWTLFLVTPFITNDYNRSGGFLRICYDWLRLSPFFLVFILNNFILLPVFMFRGRKMFYFIGLPVAIGIISVTFHIVSPAIFRNDPKILEQRTLRDPHFGREEMNPRMVPGQESPQASPGIISTTPGDFGAEGRKLPVQGRNALDLVNLVLISFLVAGFNTAIEVTRKWFENEQARKEIERERMESELAFLQNQISPHFFMNTLNNIHSLIGVDQHLAQDAVLRLSDMMRYLLYESGRGTTTLKREIDFLDSYVELMHLRVDKSINVNLELPESFTDVNLPPLLFISFIENAFKHGVSYREPSSLSFRLTQSGKTIVFESRNTISKFKPNSLRPNQGGVGLTNIRKRLAMLYGDKHDLVIDVIDNEYVVKLTIPTA